MKITSLEILFHEGLKDIYDAEKQLTKALPKLAKAADSADLKTCFKGHLATTLTHVARLEAVFELTSAKPEAKTCLAIKGLLAEGKEAISAEGTAPFTDLLIIGAARRVEHYEMAAYMSLRDLAMHLQRHDIVKLLTATLDEEAEADGALTEVAMTLMNGSGMKTGIPKKSAAAQSTQVKKKAANA